MLELLRKVLRTTVSINPILIVIEAEKLPSEVRKDIEYVSLELV